MAGDQLAAEPNLDMLMSRYGRLNTGNSPASDAEPRSDEVQQLVKVENVT